MFPDITKCPLGGESVPSLSTTGVWNKAEGDKPLSLSLPRTCQKKFCRAGNSCEMREEEGNVCLCVCVGGGLAGTKGRDTHVCACPSAVKRNMIFLGWVGRGKHKPRA